VALTAVFPSSLASRLPSRHQYAGHQPRVGTEHRKHRFTLLSGVTARAAGCCRGSGVASAKPWSWGDVLVCAVRGIRGIEVALFAALVAVVPGRAAAAFPGRNGLLAVAPRDGRGGVLVGADGRGARRICRDVCASLVRPRWSPDGRAIVFANPRIRIVYTDGSCMNCTFGASANPTFLPLGTVISFVSDRSVLLDGIDGIRQQRPPPDHASDAVWAENGWLAIVRNGAIWAGPADQATKPPDGLKPIGSGREPSWSPDSRSLAVADDGWIVVLNVRTHRARRLAVGVAPAFSPDGRLIAYIGPRRGLFVVSAVARHPRPRPVGKITGVSVDWQPLPTTGNAGCAAPSGSVALASSPAAEVTSDGVGSPSDFAFGPRAYMGCLRADGRERFLERLGPGDKDFGVSSISAAAVSAPYAALVNSYWQNHYQVRSDDVQVFDLRSGSIQKQLGGESAACVDLFPCVGGIDRVVVGSDGVSAVHSSLSGLSTSSGPGSPPITVEQIEASDRSGARTLDQATTSSGSFLTGLTLTGDTLSWNHGATPMSTTLTPP